MNGAGRVDLGSLGFDGGAHVLVKLALDEILAGEQVGVRGDHPEFIADLRTWCRTQGHAIISISDREAIEPLLDAARTELTGDVIVFVERGSATGARWVGARRAGGADATLADAVVSKPPREWGFAARGAMVELGGPTPHFALHSRDELWTDRAANLYAQAVAAQWDPESAIDWDAPITHSVNVERAVVQVMTFLIENEEAALVVPARFLGQVHPHFREIQQMLAVTVADEARHIEVFTRRALMSGGRLALSSAGGRASLQTLLEEPDYATAVFLLSVMGEGTFISLLSFLERHAPDPITRRIAHLTRQDEARHVAFAMSHLERHVGVDSGLRARLANAVDRRHQALQNSAGLNEEVFDALVVLAAGDASPESIRKGWTFVQQLQNEMAENRQGRLTRLGFTSTEAATLASMHSRNFM